MAGRLRLFDRERHRIAYRNSYETLQKGDETWVLHVIEIDVPDNAERALVGASIHEADGVMWIDRIDADEPTPL